jgi:hypothetical protein
MKTKEEIYLDEVKRASELDEKFAKILTSDAIRKFTLNCLMKMEDQFRQPDVIKSVCRCKEGKQGRTVDENWEQICDVCGGS